MRTIAVYGVRGSYVERQGWGHATVLAPSPAIALGQAIESDFLLSQAAEVTVKYVGHAYCTHPSSHGAYGNPAIWECEDCKETWPKDAEDYPEPTLQALAFEIYCESLIATGVGMGYDYSDV